MSEYIISEEGLQCMRNQCYEAGKLGKEIFTVRGHSGEEVIRCRDCGWSNDDPSCTHPRWHHGQHGVIVYPPVEPDGFCGWAERRKS